MPKQIFVNLPVKNLKKTMAFFSKLGFTFNPKFTDKKAACVVIGKNMYSMLLVEKFFQSFIKKKKIANAKQQKEVLVALSVESRKKVDEMFKKALKNGGKEFRPAEDYGWMYGRAFEDLDDHVWEVFFMDESKKPKMP